MARNSSKLTTVKTCVNVLGVAVGIVGTVLQAAAGPMSPIVSYGITLAPTITAAVNAACDRYTQQNDGIELNNCVVNITHGDHVLPTVTGTGLNGLHIDDNWCTPDNLRQQVSTYSRGSYDTPSLPGSTFDTHTSATHDMMTIGECDSL